MSNSTVHRDATRPGREPRSRAVRRAGRETPDRSSPRLAPAVYSTGVDQHKLTTCVPLLLPCVGQCIQYHNMRNLERKLDCATSSKHMTSDDMEDSKARVRARRLSNRWIDAWSPGAREIASRRETRTLLALALALALASGAPLALALALADACKWEPVGVCVSAARAALAVDTRRMRWLGMISSVSMAHLSPCLLCRRPCPCHHLRCGLDRC